MIRKNFTSGIEEIINTVTQGLGVILSVIGLITLIRYPHSQLNQVRQIGNIIYGITLILMFLTSGLFHGLFFTKAKRVFQIFDYAAIFIFIAGTYTPFDFALLHGNFQIFSLLLVWLIAALGVLLSIFFIHKKNLLLLLYLVFGWMGLIFVYPLKEISLIYLCLFIIGGMLFSLGTIFFRWEKLMFHHSIWHICILIACLFHFLTILRLQA
jgi:hemolysin III